MYHWEPPIHLKEVIVVDVPLVTMGGFMMYLKILSSQTVIVWCQIWLSGLSVGSDRNFIKPFRLIKTKFLPTKKLKDDFKLQYLGVFKLMKSSDIYLPPLDSRLIFQATRDIIYIEF